MVKSLISQAINAVSSFAMAHPVVFGTIVVTGIVVAGAYGISKLYFENQSKGNDEDRSVRTGNKSGKIGQS